MSKVKISDGYIWGIDSIWYVCISFHGSRTNFGWGPKSYQVIYRWGPSILPKIIEIQNVVWKLLREQKSADGGTESGIQISTKKHEVTPLYRDDLITVKNVNQNTTAFIHENALENVSCKMVVILFLHHCVISHNGIRSIYVHLMWWGSVSNCEMASYLPDWDLVNTWVEQDKHDALV